jgi:hypothetical protein
MLLTSHRGNLLKPGVCFMSAGTKGKVFAAPSEVVVLTPANFDKIVKDPSKDGTIPPLLAIMLHNTA